MMRLEWRGLKGPRKDAKKEREGEEDLFSKLVVEVPL